MANVDPGAQRAITLFWACALLLGVGTYFLGKLPGTSKPRARASTTAAPPSFREQGATIFARYCVACHGKGGKGGIKNPNYHRGTTPALFELAERLRLDEKEDADKVIGWLERGVRLESKLKTPPFRRYRLFVAQYNALQKLIKNGNKAGKKDPNGPAPVSMLAWGKVLRSRSIDAVIAHLVSIYPWDADDDD